MKKLLYCLAVVAFGLTSCLSFDDPTTENYGTEGPSVSVAIVNTADSSFTFTVTPGDGAQFYNFLVDQNDEPQLDAVDASTLLRGGYGNTANVREVAKEATVTIKNPAEPNTTYQVYAVAVTDKGVVGTVAVASVKTTDTGAPQLDEDSFESDPAAGTVAFDFNQAVTRGAGAVSGVYYKEWDWENPVTIPAEDITVEINGSTVVFSAKVPAGAYTSFSWEEGAFVDDAGNKSGSFSSYFDEEEVDFVGAWVHVAKAAFEISDTCVTAPASAIFGDWEAFQGELTFEFPIFRDDKAVEAGDLCVTYTSDARSATYKLAPNDWSVAGNKLTFKLPYATENGDIVTLQIAEGAFTDVYGNPNAEFASETSWKYSTFQPTKEDVLGTFSFIYTLKSNGASYNLGSFTISEYTGEDAQDGDVTISGFYLGEDALDILGYYDLAAAKLYIWQGQRLGTYEDKDNGDTYGVITYNLGDGNLIEFDITADGITSDSFMLVYCDAEYKNLIDYELPAGVTTFVKSASDEASESRVAKMWGSKQSRTFNNWKAIPSKLVKTRK